MKSCAESGAAIGAFGDPAQPKKGNLKEGSVFRIFIQSYSSDMNWPFSSNPSNGVEPTHKSYTMHPKAQISTY